MAGVPFVFGNATTSIPLSNLDANFNTGVTIGNTTVGLGNTVTTLGNVTLTNATIVANTSSIAANAVVYTTSTGNLTGNASVFTVDSSGNVGIGTTSPAAKLDVSSGAIRLSNAYQIQWFNGATQLGSILTDSGPNMTFQTGSSNTERMRIDSSGNFLVGTTAAFNSCKQALVFNGATNIGFAIKNSDATLNQTFLGFYNSAGTNIGGITQNTTTTILYNVSSDSRLKENIVDAPSGNIDNVKVRSFDWKSDNSHVKYGFIAQELVEVAPYAVHQPQDPEEMMAVDYSKLVPMMIKEIQDLKQRIKTLENK